MPDTEVVRLRELFENELRLAEDHPGYDWRSATAAGLLDDLWRLHDRRRNADIGEEPTHHLGTVVLRATDTGLAVVDGYARLSVVAAALDKLDVELPGVASLDPPTDAPVEERERIGRDNRALAETLLDYVTATVHRVDSETEARTVRAAATRPGATTTEAERVTNGLAARCERADGLEAGAGVVGSNTTLERAAVRGGVDTDDLLRAHWRLCWEPNWDPDGDESVAERVLYDERYAANARDDDATTAWIGTYQETLWLLADTYYDLTLSTDGIQPLLGDPDPQNPASLFTLAAAARFGGGDRLDSLLGFLRTTRRRTDWVAGSGPLPEAVASRLRRAAFELVWAGRAEAYRTADRDPPFEIPDSLMAGYERAWWRLQSAVGHAAPDAAFERALTREDVREGTREADGWPGVDDDALAALLGAYERHELGDDRPGGLGDDRPGHGRSQDGLEPERRDLDQVWERTAADLPVDEAQRYRATRRQIGNFVLLPATETPTDSLPYDLKHSRYYQGVDKPPLVRDLPAPASTDGRAWGPAEIRRRTAAITAFALDHWGVATGANVTLADGESLSPATARRLRRLVRERFDPADSFVPAGLDALPRVTVDARETYPPADHERSCPACGDAAVRVSDDDGVLSFECACGESLVGPPVSFHFAEP